jgi:flagellar biogenesis protein FliO
MNNERGPRTDSATPSDLSRRSGEAAQADSDMTPTYVGVVIVEGFVLFLLWLVGRVFS